MSTKLNPGTFDCYSQALPDEPTFTLAARDPDFERLVAKWARRRARDIRNGERPESDMDKVREALKTSLAGAAWRRDNMGKWRVAK